MKTSKQDAVRRQFSQNVADYRDAPVFAEGDDLRQMVESVSLTGTEHVLDLGTGAGHTALAFAHSAAMCVGLDLTEQMVNVATELSFERDVRNVKFHVGDAEDIPFDASSLDVVTCRFASHHFGDIKQAIREISRVLKPGGTFVLVDHFSSENDELDSFVNQLDWLRDLSHVREYRLSEYKACFEENALSYHVLSTWDLTLDFRSWVERGRTPIDLQEKLVAHVQNASLSCKDAFHVEFDEKGNPVSFCLKCALIHGVKQ